MPNKNRNNGKRQIPSIEAKEFYEIFMRNHDECKKKIHNLVTSYLKVHKIEQRRENKASDKHRGLQHPRLCITIKK